MVVRIPSREITKRYSAIVSSRFSRFGFEVRRDINEKIQENVSNTPTDEVNLSIICVSVMLEMCNDVITKRQKPRRFAEVFRMCCDVLFAILSI